MTSFDYAVALVNGVWVVQCWADDYQVWVMVCSGRAQAEKIAQAYSSGTELHIVMSSCGDVHTVQGVCTRARDVKRIINRLDATASQRNGYEHATVRVYQLAA